MGDGRSLKVDLTGLFCAGAACEQSDEPTCCENKGMCSVMLPGDGKVYCSSMLADCDEGLVANAVKVECYEGGCTSERCCVSASGVNLETERQEPVAQDTFQAAFKIEASFEALDNDPDLKAALSTG